MQINNGRLLGEATINDGNQGIKVSSSSCAMIHSKAVSQDDFHMSVSSIEYASGEGLFHTKVRGGVDGRSRWPDCKIAEVPPQVDLLA